MHSLSSQLLQEQRLVLMWRGRSSGAGGAAWSDRGSPKPEVHKGPGV